MQKIDRKYVKNKLKIINAGSYRLGKASSGDIDLIITVDNKHSTTEIKQKTKQDIIQDIMKNIRDILMNEKILLHELSVGKTKIIGIMKIPEKYKKNKKTGMKYNTIAHQLDISVIDNEDLPWYLLYFGSDKIFSKKIRFYASKKGYKLNEKGLYDKKTGKRIDFIPKNEKDIFTFLGIHYVYPKNRSYTNKFVEL